MSILISIIIFFLILSFLVLIHELGHFVTALWAGVNIQEFGFGYPPRAFTLFHWRGIPFTVNWLPFGGFVRMEGEDREQENEETKKQKKSKTHISHPTSHNLSPFYKVSKPKRLVILLAGVFMNFVFGIVAFATVFSFIGIPEKIYGAKIGAIQENSPAENSSLEVGDTIVGIKPFTPQKSEGTYSLVEGPVDVIRFVNEHKGEEVMLQIEREGGTKEISVYARKDDEKKEDEGSIGVGFEGIDFLGQTVELKKYPWYQMPVRGSYVGLQHSLIMAREIPLAFKRMFTNMIFKARLPEDVAGPVGIVHQVAQQRLFEGGIVAILHFAGMLSINLAIINLLPIPALDGGRVFFILLETVIGKKYVAKFEHHANYVGFIILLFLIFLITVSDIVKVIMSVMGKG